MATTVFVRSRMRSPPTRWPKRPWPLAETAPGTPYTRRMSAGDVLDLFVELAAIPSPPGDERAVADRVAAYLQELGLGVEEDDAGPRIGKCIR